MRRLRLLTPVVAGLTVRSSLSYTLYFHNLALHRPNSFRMSSLAAEKLSTLSSASEARQWVCQKALASGITVTKCGEMACQMNSFAKTLKTAKLVSVVPFVNEAQGGKKKKKKTKPAAKTEGAATITVDESSCDKTQYMVALTDSIFYPEGGGQPSDTGRIKIYASSSSLSTPPLLELIVKEASGVDELCLLTCIAPRDVSSPQVIQALTSEDASLVQELDWNRRFEYMTQHSAQHLMSAIALAEPFGMPTHSFSLSTKGLISYVDFNVDPEVETHVHCETMRTIENVANDRIRENLSMTPRYVDPSDLSQNNEVRSRLLPQGITGKIRLVEIGSTDDLLDCNTCCGTHVSSLGYLQMIKFFRLERVKPSVMRVHFAAATRLTNVMDQMYERQSKLTTFLSSPEDEIVPRLSQLLDDKKEKEREIKGLQNKLCDFQAREILVKLKENDNVAVMDVGESDMGYMVALASLVADKMASTNGVLLLLVGGKEGEEEGNFLLTGDVALVDKMGKKVAQVVGGRGGGKNGRYQGKGTKIRGALAEVQTVLVQKVG